MRTRRWFFVLLVVVGAAAFGRGLVPLLLRAQGLSVGGYQLVNEERVSRTVSEFTYRARLTNPGSSIAGATARVTSRSPRTVIVEGDLTFGPVAAGATAVSQDTFVFRQDRTVAFNPADLTWAVTPAAANQAPDAVIAPVAQVFVTQPVALDASGSSDPEGAALTFAWSIISRPAGSGAVIAPATAAKAGFLPDRAGSYLVRVQVSDGQLTATADVTITTSNSAPRANAGPDQTAARGSTVTLDGGGSSDVDGNTLTYQWSVASQPAGSAVALSDATAVRPTFLLAVGGEYRFSLVVHDGQVVSGPDLVTVDTSNSPPVANAGADRTAARGALVQLDASASSDVDGDPLTYIWEFQAVPAGSTAALANPNAVQATFTADVRGDFVVRLTVSDGMATSQDTVTITTENTRPIANGGPDRTTPLGATVALDGSNSTDVDSDSLTYQWSLIKAPVLSAAALSDPSAVSPTFVADLPGEYVVQLIVNDGLAASVPDTVTISTENTRPIAEAGANQSVLQGTTVLLDGTGSRDPDSDPIRYMWSLITVPQGSTATLNDSASPTPTFVADRPGIYLAQLEVDDGRLVSQPDTVIVTTAMNSLPVANAGPDQAEVVAGSLVTLDGSASSDADGHALTYQWSLLTVPPGSQATLSNATAVRPTFVPDAPGTYVAQLIVDDGFFPSAPDAVQIEVRAANRPPVANAGPDVSVVVGEAIVLNGTGSSDPDTDPLTFAWTVTLAPTGSTATLVNPTSSTPSLTPDLAGSYVVSLVVGDGMLLSVADTVVVTAVEAQGPPTITGFAPTSGRAGTTVTIAGTNFVDVETVTFNGILAPSFTVLGTGSITVVVPETATTGPISVTTSAGSATSSGHFVVLPTEDFQLAVTPELITVAAGGQGAFQLSVTGSDGFANLATLGVTGVPAGATAAFVAPTLTVGQSTQLNVQVGSATGSFPLTVSATGLVNNVETTRSVTVTVQVAAQGVTSIAGQFLTIAEVPIPNVMVQIGAIQTHSDAAGNFLLQGVPDGLQPLMIDANVAVAGYPIYKVDLQVVAGQLLSLPPFRITPPPAPERYVPINTAAGAQVVTDARYPGFELTLPAGSRIVGWDGIVKQRVAIERILPSQLPVPPPPGPTNSLYQIHFGTPMGGIPSARLPVTLPNDHGLDPGQQAELWWYDAAPTGGPGAWKMAGMATVSADGTKVASNPGVGIDRFCGVCGLVCIISRQEGEPNPNEEGEQDADPVDIALGQMVVDKTDLVLPGRIPALVHRRHYPIDPFGGISGFQLGYGPGWALSVDVVLLEINSSLRRLVVPGSARHEFVRQPDGTFINQTHRRFIGAVLSIESGGAHRLRFKNGTTWRFGGTGLPGVGILVEESDRNGNRLTIQRSSGGVISRIVEPSGRAISFTYAGGRVSQVVDPIGRTVRYTYDASRRLETVTDAAGGVTRYSYDAADRIVTITDAKGILFLRNEYSPLSGRILRQIEADGSAWQFRYRVLPRVLAPVPFALNPSAVEESVASLAAGLTGDLRNAPISTTVVDPRGNTRTYTVHGGWHTALTDALGQTTQIERTNSGQILSVRDPLARVTRFAYDVRGNITRVTDPQNNATVIDYEATFSRVTRMVDPAGNVTAFEYDARGNLVGITDPEQNSRPESERKKTTIEYDEFGQAIAAIDPLGNRTTLTYDDRGDLVAVSDPLGNTSRLTYDAVSRVIAQIDPRARTTGFAYDALNQLATVTDALDGVTGFTYDANGNLLTVADAHDNTVRYHYNSMDRLERRVDQLGRAETFAYDANGNLTGATDRKGQTTTFSYDRLDRHIEARFADGAFAEYRYDAVSRLVQASDSTDPHRPIKLDYDGLDRLQVETTAIGSVRYAYDSLGRRTQMVASGAEAVHYGYDRNSRLRSVTQAPLNPATFDYDAADRRTRLTLPNGVSTDYQYDEASRLTALIYQSALGSLGNLTYQYDQSGNRVGIGGSLARSQLPDPVGQAAYDAANQQLQFGSRQLTYDSNGNLESMTEAAGQTQFAWDARNRLTAFTGPGVSASFAYDAFGRRASKNINGRSTQFLYDGLDFIAESGSSGPISYLRSLFIDEALVRDRTENLLADAIGSTVALTDVAGSIATEYRYGPFGQGAEAGASTDNSIQYAGRENDGTSLYFNRSRFYSPVLHRFISEDPVEFGGGDINLFAYVSNDPVSWVDPLGQERWFEACGVQEEQVDSNGELSGRKGTPQSPSAMTVLSEFGEVGGQYALGTYDLLAAWLFSTARVTYTGAQLTPAALWKKVAVGRALVKAPTGFVQKRVKREIGQAVIEETVEQWLDDQIRKHARSAVGRARTIRSNCLWR